MWTAAQVSLYPLRQPSLSPAIEKALGVFRERGLDVAPGAMSSVVSGEDDALFGALSEVFRQTAEQGDVVMAVTISNGCPVPGLEAEQANARSGRVRRRAEES